MDKYKSTINPIEERAAPVPLFQSETAERVLKHVWIPLSVLLGSIPLSIGATWFFHRWDMLNIMPIGLMASGGLMLVITLNELGIHLDWHPFRDFLDLLDRKRDGRVFGIPIADEYSDEAQSEIELERRVRRAIRAVVEQGVKATRESIQQEHRLMSQQEWYFWHIRMIKSGIISEQNYVLVPSTESAFQKWDAFTQSKNRDRGFHRVNIGEGRVMAMVLASDLMNKEYVK